MRKGKRASHPRKRAAADARGTGMRRLRYSVAMSLDGFIAGPNGEFDWIVMDPTFDFAALFSEFDTLLMGRHTFDLIRQGPRKNDGGNANCSVLARVFRSCQQARALLPCGCPTAKPCPAGLCFLLTRSAMAPPNSTADASLNALDSALSCVPILLMPFLELSKLPEPLERAPDLRHLQLVPAAKLFQPYTFESGSLQ
jgi:dihydrofolate reductase